MNARMIRTANRLCLLTAVLLITAGAVHAQSGAAVSGRWVWKEIARKNKPQTQFTVVVRREGNVFLGTYSVDEFINGEWQGEDGNQTAFRGRLTNGRVQIEFDPSATAPGYEQNVTYKSPTDGRRPSLAVLTRRGQTVLWRLVRGARLEGVPATLTLHRERRPR